MLVRRYRDGSRSAHRGEARVGGGGGGTHALDVQPVARATGTQLCKNRATRATPPLLHAAPLATWPSAPLLPWPPDPLRSSLAAFRRRSARSRRAAPSARGSRPRGRRAAAWARPPASPHSRATLPAFNRTPASRARGARCRRTRAARRPSATPSRGYPPIRPRGHRARSEAGAPPPAHASISARLSVRHVPPPQRSTELLHPPTAGGGKTALSAAWERRRVFLAPGRAPRRPLRANASIIAGTRAPAHRSNPLCAPPARTEAAAAPPRPR